MAGAVQALPPTTRTIGTKVEMQTSAGGDWRDRTNGSSTTMRLGLRLEIRSPAKLRFRRTTDLVSPR